MKKQWWQFWKKEEPEKYGFVFTVPEDETLHIFELIDNYNARSDGSNKVARYCLWKAIHRIFPQTQEGSWTIDCSRATKIIITENPA